MNRNRVMYLIEQTVAKDSIGQQKFTETARKVYCRLESIGQNEFFEAQRSGLNPKYRVKMFAPDYHGEKTATIDDVRYAIYRTYQTKSNVVELYLQFEAGA